MFLSIFGFRKISDLSARRLDWKEMDLAVEEAERKGNGAELPRSPNNAPIDLPLAGRSWIRKN